MGFGILIWLIRNELAGYCDYESPMLLTIKRRNKLEIHNGNLMDYIVNIRWNQKGNKAKKLILYYYLSGLTKIIDNIEDGKISKNINIVGTSYFFNKNTAKKFGFTI